MPDDHKLPSADEQGEERLSKSEMKRRMTALQELGETLTRLSDRELQRIPLSDPRLLQALMEARNISSNSARRRHMQYIGKLMRAIDPAPIEAALNALYREQRTSADRLHELERLRDELLASGLEGIERIVAHWPAADRQHLRQLVLQHQRERARGKPPAASRKLFRYLRELQESG
jgi:ribosome-associated protein